MLSNGHGSMLQYALLHLTGYDLPIDELQALPPARTRRRPGHPEVGVTPGVETTTGPLGQGLANAVGMALAERLLAATFNRPGHAIVDHRTYVFVGDGCLMEGISHEACSLAGTLGLGKLIAFYDDNGISIDGEVDGWFTDDTPKRFEAYGWHVIRDVDGHDVAAVDAAIRDAKARRRQADAHLLQDRSSARARPTRPARPKRTARRSARRKSRRRARRSAGRIRRSRSPTPSTPAGTRATRGAALEQRMERALRGVPRRASRARRRVRAAAWPASCPPTSPRSRDAFVAAQAAKAETIATRKASQQAIEAFARALPEMLGGSADLTGSRVHQLVGQQRR